MNRDRYTTTEADAAAYERHFYGDGFDDDTPTLAEFEANERAVREDDEQ